MGKKVARNLKIGQRVQMNSGRRWAGTVVGLCDAYPAVDMVTVRWDNGRRQTVNVFMMNLVKVKTKAPATV